MISLVDARSGKLVRLGDTVDGAVIVDVFPYVLSADVLVTRDGKPSVVKSPIKYFPQLTYGSQFPSNSFRCVVIPT